MNADRFYAIDGDQIARLERISKRLFTENRMDGDQMRDAAQTIEAVIRIVRQTPLTEAEIGS